MLLDLYAATADNTNLAPLARETLTYDPADSTAREYADIVAGSTTGTSADWFRRGLARTDAGRHGAAAAAYRVAVKLDPANEDAWNNLGLSLAELGYRPEAVKMFERALRLKPDDVAAKSNLARAKAGDIASMKSSAPVGAGDGKVEKFTHAFELQTSGRSAEAVPIYRELLATYPRWVNAHYNLGFALMTIGDCPAAISEFEATLAIQPDYPLAHLHLSTCFGKLKKPADSMQHRAIYDQSLRR
jgi:tetratricopeptide (TPR) repeat protein